MADQILNSNQANPQAFSPIVVQESDIPPPPQTVQPDFQTIGQETEKPKDTGDKLPDENEPIVISPSPPTQGKKFPKKVFVTTFGILVLLAGVAAGIILLRQRQELREKAASGVECDHSPDCDLLDDAENEGSYTAGRTITHIFITAKEFHRYNPGETDDGCYRVSIGGRSLTWRKVGSGPDCKDISNIQVWLGEGPTPTLPPDISASCREIKTYDTAWNLLTQTQLANLQAGDKVRFATSGSASSGSFDKAKFRINGTLTPDVTSKKPGTDEFYYEYTIRTGDLGTTMNVNAWVHHSELNRWF